MNDFLHKLAPFISNHAALSALFVVSYVGWLPIADRDVEDRVLAHIAAACSAILGLMRLSLMGVSRRADRGWRLRQRSRPGRLVSPTLDMLSTAAARCVTRGVRRICHSAAHHRV